KNDVETVKAGNGFLALKSNHLESRETFAIEIEGEQEFSIGGTGHCGLLLFAAQLQHDLYARFLRCAGVNQPCIVAQCCPVPLRGTEVYGLHGTFAQLQFKPYL